MHHCPLCLLLMVLSGTSVGQAAARHLMRDPFPSVGLAEDPATYSTSNGQRPFGNWAYTTQGAEAVSGGGSKGIRYNSGKVVSAGDAYPASRSASTTGQVTTASGNYPGEAVMNLGTHVTAATYEGARAVAGSGVMHTAGIGATVSHTLRLLRPETAINKGSGAFTDLPPSSAANSEQGNGPAVVAWGREAAASSRAQKIPKYRTHMGMHDDRRRRRNLLLRAKSA